MSEPQQHGADRLEIARLLDELEQVHTALETSNEEIARLAADRERLLMQLAAQGCQLHAINETYVQTLDGLATRSSAALAEAHRSQADEELRAAFEELQVLTEELEVANTSLSETNRGLDRRVEERTQELERKNLALTRSELRFRTLVEGMPQLVWRGGPTGDWTWSSPQWTEYTGQSLAESRGMGWLQAHHPDDRVAVQAAWVRAQTGLALEYESRIFHAGEGRHRHFRTRSTAALTEQGEVVEWLGACTDVDDLVSLQERQGVLVAELQHRTRNLMTVVQAILRRTLGSSASLEEFDQRMTDRMGALARVQSLLSRRGEGRVAFAALLREEIEAHVVLDAPDSAGQVTIGGPAEVWLYSSTVQTLALGLHELTTNAVKYGALSTPGGRLEVRWSVADMEAGKRRLRIDWRESGVDMAAAPVSGGGYGRELIERALPYQLGAATTYAFAEDGVRCSIEVTVAGD